MPSCCSSKSRPSASRSSSAPAATGPSARPRGGRRALQGWPAVRRRCPTAPPRRAAAHSRGARRAAHGAFCSTSRMVMPWSRLSSPDDLEHAPDVDRRQAQRGLVEHQQAGRPISARAIASICCSPPDSVPARCAGAAPGSGTSRTCAQVGIEVGRIGEGRADLDVLQHRHAREYPPPFRHQRDAAAATSCGLRRVMSRPRTRSARRWHAAHRTASSSASTCRRRWRRSASPPRRCRPRGPDPSRHGYGRNGCAHRQFQQAHAATSSESSSPR